jgi:hypothetical protein
MVEGFSNEATRAVYESIANRPDVYERLAQVSVERPASAVEALKQFISNEKRSWAVTVAGTIVEQLADAAFTEVKWHEVRDVLKKQAA